jgi:DNA-binding CsgD family transcriptional regulator
VSVPEMAKTLWLSPYTVRDHIKAIYGKLGV